MKKGLIKAGVLVAVFFAALIGFSLMTNQTNKDLTTDMANATLPMIDLYTGTQKINELHGYTVQMDASYMRDTITPVGTDMKVPATIQTFGTDVDAISYKDLQYGRKGSDRGGGDHGLYGKRRSDLDADPDPEPDQGGTGV